MSVTTAADIRTRWRGDVIPLIARIVAVCDAYEAMVTRRTYRAARETPAAIDELRRCSGTQFDPEVVEAFVSALEAVDDRAQVEALFTGTNTRLQAEEPEPSVA
jgi:HD-GYP domain-containing protein (c-di-GMP phosphodiesterase class II)